LSPSLTRRQILLAAGTGALTLGCAGPSGDGGRAVDLVVYGATPAGLAAAVQLRRMGGSVVVLEPSRHLGGMTTSGLGATDVGNPDAVGGVAAEFYRRVHAKYAGSEVASSTPARYIFEPHVASAVFADMLEEVDVQVVLDAQLHAVRSKGDRLTGLVTADGHLYPARMFLDASYEGDLMARAGVGFTTGREGNAHFGERINGVQHRDGHQFDAAVDPYMRAGSPSSGLLPGISAAVLEPNGTADDAIQAYNFRMCLTQAPDRIRFSKPDSYDPLRYELLLRYLYAGNRGPFFTTVAMGHGKTDSNNKGAFSTDFIGGNVGYPTASHAVRRQIVAEHRSYQEGFFWFLANDPRVPESVRRSVSSWGLPTDEFAATGGWPPQLYVREARRMTSAYVVTEHDCRGALVASDSVGLASYTMDSHNCRRLVVDGAVTNEGDVQAPVPAPYPISYRSIVPRASECTNLLVPVALSASHIAYGSIRMEPVFMVLGQSAATAAYLAIMGGSTLQEVSVPALQKQLRVDGQILDWTPSGAR